MVLGLVVMGYEQGYDSGDGYGGGWVILWDGGWANG